MEAVTPDKEISGMTIADLWIEIRIACGSAPRRSQFYEWLRASGEGIRSAAQQFLDCQE